MVATKIVLILWLMMGDQAMSRTEVYSSVEDCAAAGTQKVMTGQATSFACVRESMLDHVLGR